MARKTHFAGFAAAAATLAITFASAEISGANAQQGIEEEIQISTSPVTDETVPVFISEEVVQPLPEKAETVEVETSSIVAPQAASLRELVNKTDTGFELSREMECLAGTVYFESRGEPLAGQLAVAQVVINRAESSRFPLQLLRSCIPTFAV